MAKSDLLQLNSDRIQRRTDHRHRQSRRSRKVAYFGDAWCAYGTLSGTDATFISRNTVALDTGFSAYPLTDPRLVTAT